MTYTFEIPGPPAPWQVYTRRGRPSIGILNLWTYQEIVQGHLRMQVGKLGLVFPLQGLVVLDLLFVLPYPASAPKGEAARERWAVKHLAMKPDTSNLVKAVEDSCQGILLNNDSQVVDLHGRKMFGDPPKTTIYVRQL